ncbi:MAG: transglutaminase domain-containing protein [Oscillospiraceae bacterium]|nr:transglutaminase domain-containing protein [Oscillospiraceae bacterium]
MNLPDKHAENQRESRVQYNPATLLLQENVSISVRDQRSMPHHLLRLLLSLCGLIGSFWCFDGFFHPDWNLKLICLFLVGFAALTRFLYRNSRYGTLLLLGETAAVCLVLLRFMEPAAEGAYSLFRLMSQTVLKDPFTHDLPGHLSNGWSSRQMIMLAAVTIAALLTIITEYAENCRFCFLLRFLITFMFLETGLYFGLETNPIAVLLLIAYWIGSLVISLSAETRRRGERQQRSAVRDKTISVVAGNPQTAADSALALLLAVTAVLGLVIGIGTTRYVRSESLNRKRTQIMEAVRNITIHDLTGWLSKIDLGDGPNVISDEIDLKHNSDLHFNGSIVMDVEVDNSVRKDDYYLRGMVRNEYTGEGWALKRGSYKRVRDLLKELADMNRMPQTIWHSDYSYEYRGESGKFPVVNWNIRTRKSEDRNYLPYQALMPENAKYSYDTEIKLDSQKQYDFMTINNAAIDWDRMSVSERASNDPKISEYERFVEEEYLNVPDNDAMRRIKMDFSSQYYINGQDLGSMLNMIRNYIWDHATYDTAPGDFPNDRDFAEYFLFEGHRGYCAHYASAAVLLCRMNGIPARYAQGYVVSEDDFVLKNPDGSKYTIPVRDHRAHAWAEIYVKGFGWVPYEFTEGIEGQWRDSAPEQTAPPQNTTTETSLTTTTRTTAASAQTTEAVTTASPAGTSRISFRLPEWAKKALKAAGITGAVLAVIILIVLLWRAYHFRTVQRRKDAMRQKDANRASGASYAFLLRLLRMQGIQQGNALHGDFAETAEEACELLDAGKLARAVDVQQKAVFSKEGVSAEEAAELCSTAEQLAEVMFSQADRRHRLHLRWFRHIVK